MRIVQSREPEFPEIPRGSDFMEAPEPKPHRKSRQSMERRDIEELAEVIVDEKLRAMADRFKAIDAKFNSLGGRIEAISEDVNKIRSQKSGEVQSIESKIEEYSKGMTEMNGRMESMERAFKDSLSPMLESMRSLSDLVKSMKKETKKE